MNIKLKRIERGIKQQDMANQLGISKGTMIKIEKGNYDLKLSLMKKISQVLETSVQELFFN